MHYELLTKQVCNLSRNVGNYIRNELSNIRKSDIQEKDRNNYVTYVDKEAEKRLVSELGKIIPGSGFVAEENSKLEKSDEFNWVIDPLDGTTNFIHGIPIFCISIALMQKNNVVSGVVYELNTQECFYSWEGAPAYMNRDIIHVSDRENLGDSLLATGFPYYDYSRMEQYIEVFRILMKESAGIRRMGSAALDLAYVACGRFDGFFEYGLHPWDVAAGSFILQQAGGMVSDFSGSNNHIHGNEIVGGNPAIHKRLLGIIREKFNQ